MAKCDASGFVLTTFYEKVTNAIRDIKRQERADREIFDALRDVVTAYQRDARYSVADLGGNRGAVVTNGEHACEFDVVDGKIHVTVKKQAAGVYSSIEEATAPMAIFTAQAILDLEAAQQRLAKAYG